MITEQLAIQHIVSQNGYQRPPHFHDMNEILFHTGDDCTLYIGHETYQLRSGMLVFISPGTIHLKINHEGEQIDTRLIHYPSSLLNALSTPQTNMHLLFSNLNACLQLPPESLHMFTMMFNELDGDNKKEDSELSNILTLGSILLQSARLFRSQGAVQPSPLTTTDKWLLPILEYIDNHLTEPFTLDDLCSRFSISKGSLCHTFKRKTGFTVISYINLQRIRHACVLLRNGYSVQNTCTLSGFASIEHFIRTFKVFADTTPGKYARTVAQSKGLVSPLNVCHAAEYAHVFEDEND
ncbi:MAG: AraC family transcriptional regulator [Clostridia bacterium]|nr:AraC family transcriptional regulator [Clostridia bacterium]